MPLLSTILHTHREVIIKTVSQFKVCNPRIFGSVIHHIDHKGSDLDLLVDTLPETTLFDLGGLQDELETRLGIRVDVRTPLDLPASFRQQVLQEAIPL